MTYLKRLFLLLVLLASMMKAGAAVPVYAWTGWDEKTTSQELLKQFKDWKKRGVVGVCVNCGFNIDRIREASRMARKAGADGVVFGVLNTDGTVNLEAMRRLMDAARGMNVTFHRAFDVCCNPLETLEQIISLGCDHILTSGQEPTAEKGIALLSQLNERAAGRITIMPGCGVNAGNIAHIASATGCREFHFSGRSEVASAMRYRNPKVSMSGTDGSDEYSRQLTDPEKIRAAREALESLSQKK